MSTVLHRGLADELRRIGSYDAEACMNCGVCTAVCPLDIDLLPRRLFRYVELGLAERVREESEIIFSCLLCRACEESCPADVHITENVRVLRHWLLEDEH
jgi:heterodisulfide reductase subunit C